MSSNYQSIQQDYIKSIQTNNKEMISLQISIISYIDDSIKIESINDLLNQHNILDDEYKLNDFLKLLNSISSSRFKPKEINKLNEIISFLKPKLVEKYTKKEIFLIFQSNMPILLYLYENQIIDFEPFLEYPQYELYRFFLPEYIEHGKIEKLKKFFGDEINEYITDLNCFKNKRKEYHSDSKIAKIIRDYDVEAFIDFVSHTNLDLNYKIPNSFYEINSDLRSLCSSLIEYSAVFQSIQIFKYLFNHIQRLPGDIFLAAVLGGNADIIHLIKSRGIQPKNFELFRSILAHQINLFDYFVSNYSLELHIDLVRDSIRSFNYFIFNELLIRKQDFLTNIDCINCMFVEACAADSRVLFNILYDIPNLDVNAQQEIFYLFE